MHHIDFRKRTLENFQINFGYVLVSYFEWNEAMCLKKNHTTNRVLTTSVSDQILLTLAVKFRKAQLFVGSTAK
jgi:hypothetical protein